MRIDVHIVMLMMQEDAKAQIRSAGLSPDLEVDSGRIIVAADSEDFQTVLNVTRGTSGIAWTPDVTYSRKETGAVDIFEVWGRRSTPETAADNALNFETLERAVPVETSPNVRVKLLRPIHLSKLRGKPNEALRLDEWAEEYILGSAAEQAFADCKLRGYEMLPVLRSKDNQSFAGYSQIFTDRILPLSVQDSSIVEVRSQYEERSWWKRRLGSLTYDHDDFSSDSDFWRTAEPWGSNGLPLWIVSRKTMQCFEASRLKGWSFRPVLWKGSPLHQEYLERWEGLLRSLAANPRNRLW